MKRTILALGLLLCVALLCLSYLDNRFEPRYPPNWAFSEIDTHIEKWCAEMRAECKPGGGSLLFRDVEHERFNHEWCYRPSVQFRPNSTSRWQEQTFQFLIQHEWQTKLVEEIPSCDTLWRTALPHRIP